MTEQLERFAFVFLLRLLLGITAQVNTLAQVVQRAQVFTPVGIYALQQNHTFELGEVVTANQRHLGVESCVGCGLDFLENLFVGDCSRRLNLFVQCKINLPICHQRLFQRRDIPLLFHRFGWHILPHEICETTFAQGRNLAGQVGRIQDAVALLVDYLTLVVGYVVILQQLLAHVEVARFHLALRALDAAGHDAGLNRLAIRHLQPVHDRLHPVAGKDAHQGVVQTQIKA